MHRKFLFKQPHINREMDLASLITFLEAKEKNKCYFARTSLNAISFFTFLTGVGILAYLLLNRDKFLAETAAFDEQLNSKQIELQNIMDKIDPANNSSCSNTYGSITKCYYSDRSGWCWKASDHWCWFFRETKELSLFCAAPLEKLCDELTKMDSEILSKRLSIIAEPIVITFVLLAATMIFCGIKMKIKDRQTISSCLTKSEMNALTDICQNLNIAEPAQNAILYSFIERLKETKQKQEETALLV